MLQKCISTISAVLLIGTAPLALAQSIIQDKQETTTAIEEALTTSQSKAAAIPDLEASKQSLNAVVNTKEATIMQVQKEKRLVRLQIAAQKKLAEEYKVQFGLEPTDTDELFKQHEQQLAKLQKFVQEYSRMLAMQTAQQENIFQASLLQIVQQSPLVNFEDIARRKVLIASQKQLTELTKNAVSLPTTLTALTKEHQELLEAYHNAAAEQKDARFKIQLNNQQLKDIKRIMAQVEDRVRIMQLEMARIDDKLRMQAEQALIAKGLRTKQTTIVSRRPTFIWPALGRITATFYDAGYQAFFGVPHKAIDIAIPQASQLKAASDGIVYFVKNGGQTGYSYILIGHRDGYATLYGHVLQSYVAKGDTVSQGETIGLSGGRPGTIGAGPMTTGPHLHFETIKDGKHIDPMTILPAR